MRLFGEVLVTFEDFNDYVHKNLFFPCQALTSNTIGLIAMNPLREVVALDMMNLPGEDAQPG